MLGLPKIESLREVPNILLERGITQKRGVDVEMGGGLSLFYYFTVQLQLLCLCVWGEGGGVKFPLLHFGASVF